MQASNGKLFGTTSEGGSSDAGVIFSFDIDSNTYSKVYDFDVVNGANPDCDIYELSTSNTGISAVNNALELSIFPNPAIDNLTISVEENMIGGTATVSDVTGRRMTTVQLVTRNTQFITSYFSTGLILLQLKQKRGGLQRK